MKAISKNAKKEVEKSFEDEKQERTDESLMLMREEMKEREARKLAFRK